MRESAYKRLTVNSSILSHGISKVKMNWQTISDIISEKCQECWPYQEDCNAFEVCNIYLIKKREKRELRSTGELIDIIRQECKICIGCKDPEIFCSSFNCPFYDFIGV